MEKVQVLMVTMNMENADELLTRTNIQTSFVIGNQCDRDDKQEISRNGHDGLVVSRSERGVGNNRNITLKYASGEYCVLADDDMRFYDDYEETVIQVFESYSDADIIIFNIDEEQTERRVNNRVKHIHLWNYLNYGAARIAFRRSVISYNGIAFNTNFGGGTPHSAGEDSLFLRECLRHRLRILAVPVAVARLEDNRSSTWFTGYNRKYFNDKGVFLGVAHRKAAKLLALLYAVKDGKKTSELKGIPAVYGCIREGIKFVRRGFRQSCSN